MGYKEVTNSFHPQHVYMGMKTTLTTLVLFCACLLVPLSAAEKTSSGVSIPKAAKAFNGHHYLVVDNVDDLNWHDAKKQCEAWGGHLATISSKEEAEFISKLADGVYLYLGATDEKKEDTWEWVDGTKWSYTNWMEGQPNDYGGSEDYLATYDGGEWVDVDSEGSGFWMPTGFICEWDE